MGKRYFVTAGELPVHLGGTDNFTDFRQADGVAFDKGPRHDVDTIVWEVTDEKRAEPVAIWSRNT